MKKIVKLSLIIFIIICITNNVYAMTTCNVELSTSSTEVSKNEEFVVAVRLSNVQTDEGADMFQLTLLYDKECLEIVKMQGQNDWNTPKAGSSYNPANGKMILEKDGFIEDDETILKITFKVKDDTQSNTTISINNTKISDGDSLITLNNVGKDINIVGGQTPPDDTSDETPDDGTNETPDNESDNTSGGTQNKDSNEKQNNNSDEKSETTSDEENQENNEEKVDEKSNTKADNTFVLGVNKDSNTEEADNNEYNGTLPKAGNVNMTNIMNIILIIIIICVLIALGFIIKDKFNKNINKRTRHGR